MSENAGYSLHGNAIDHRDTDVNFRKVGKRLIPEHEQCKMVMFVADIAMVVFFSNL